MPWPREAFCPSCERFIGPAEECPYCNADAAVNPMLKLLRRGSVVLALAGLAGLYVMAVSRRPASIRAIDISPRMNYAHAIASGTVVANSRVREGSGQSAYVSFMVDDGTGRIRVFATGNGARELIEQGRIPRKGNTVQVIGQLNLAAGRLPQLRLNGPDQLTIRDTPPPPQAGDVLRDASDSGRAGTGAP